MLSTLNSLGFQCKLQLFSASENQAHMGSWLLPEATNDLSPDLYCYSVLVLFSAVIFLPHGWQKPSQVALC